MRRICTLLVLSYTFLWGMEVSGQTANTPAMQPKLPFNPRQYLCYKTPYELTIDGKMDEDIWEKTPWTEDFEDIEGHLKPKPLYRTRTKMLWDENYLYVAAELEEPHIWANITERDAIMYFNNDFEIFIDPDGDTHLYYEFEYNAYATRWDLILVKPYRDGGPYMNAWDVRGMLVATHLDGTINHPNDVDKSWSIEVALPWELLKEANPNRKIPKPGDQWRINFSRVQWQHEIIDGNYKKKVDPETGKRLPEYNWVWSPQGVINMHYPEMWGFLQFSGKEAGTESDTFQFNPDEDLKWALRQVYYRMREHKQKTGKYTNDPQALGIKYIKANGIDELKVNIQHTERLFEASATHPKTQSTYCIRQDGLIWKLN
ncbi:carbohydrate-binding family 9-like protein [Rapidithrix thailandica]|uniref:Carbohydrate-binding family 9-like protein n=1 Tax=Rapidithrix thailandica TaxID=413964 RepID=A0AAW9SBA7_9BACT